MPAFLASCDWQVGSALVPSVGTTGILNLTVTCTPTAGTDSDSDCFGTNDNCPTVYNPDQVRPSSPNSCPGSFVD